MGVCISGFATMSASLENTYASIPATTRGKPFFLGGDPKGENFLYSCGNSVIIRNIANPRLLKLMTNINMHLLLPSILQVVITFALQMLLAEYVFGIPLKKNI